MFFKLDIANSPDDDAKCSVLRVKLDADDTQQQCCKHSIPVTALQLVIHHWCTVDLFARIDGCIGC